MFHIMKAALIAAATARENKSNNAEFNRALDNVLDSVSALMRFL